MRPGRAAAAGLAAVALSTATAAASGGRHDPSTVRGVARSVLDGDRYQEPRGNFVGDAVRWLLEHLFPESLRSGGGGGGAVPGYLFALGLLVGVAYLLWRLVRAWQPRPRPEVDEAELVVDVDEHRTADEWAALAERLAGEGRHREALRARFGELVARLVDDGSVSAAAGRTTGELRDDLAASRPAARAAFGEACDRFERAWYGGEAVDASGPVRVRDLAASVLRSPRAGEQPAEPVGVAAP